MSEQNTVNPVWQDIFDTLVKWKDAGTYKQADKVFSVFLERERELKNQCNMSYVGSLKQRIEGYEEQLTALGKEKEEDVCAMRKYCNRYQSKQEDSFPVEWQEGVQVSAIDRYLNCNNGTMWKIHSADFEKNEVVLLREFGSVMLTITSQQLLREFRKIFQ